MPNLTKIAPGPDNRIALQFETGEAFEVAALDLRFACPCANCVDETTGKRTLKRESLRPDVRPVKIEPVGRYGIHIEWNDGHRTGMYHFDNLYSMVKNPKIDPQVDPKIDPKDQTVQ